MDTQFGNPENLRYLWLVLVVAISMVFAFVARRRAMYRFATSDVVPSIFPRRTRTAWATNFLAIATLLALMPALCDIRWGRTWREIPQKGIEVVFALDVSRSMLAEDVAPNRLERAKQQIKDMVDEMAGDRVGLIAFAGDAVRKIPLTSHYSDFKRALDEVGPQDVSHGGSNLGEAVRVAADSFLAKTTDHKAVVLFTDGEDHESDPAGVAGQVFQDHGIRIFTVGLGDDRQGARVPASNSDRGTRYLEHDGRQVWSKLDGKILEQMALASNGAFIPAGTKQVNMAQVYHNYVADVEQQDFETARINSYIPRFQWFVGAALGLCVVEVLIAALAGRRFLPRQAAASARTDRKTATRQRVKQRLSSAAAVVALVLSGAAEDARADELDAFALAEQGSQAVAAGEYAKALDYYSQATAAEPDNLELKYNQAVALYRSGDVDAARQQFAEATATKDRGLEARARFNLANCDYADALRLAEQDREAAKAKAKSAISHYRGALAANSADTDARTNIELAALLLRQLNEQPPAEQEQQAEQDQQADQQPPQQQDRDASQEAQSSSEQESESGEQSQSENHSAEDSGDDQNQQNDQKQSEPNQGESQSDQQSADPSENNNGQEDQDTGQREPQPSSPSEDDQSKSEKAESSNSSQQQQPDQSDRDAAASHSETSRENQSQQQFDAEEAEDPSDEQNANPPSGRLRAANEQPGDEEARELTMNQVDAGKPMTRQEAMKMLQSVRDRELLRRLRNARRAQRRYIPGEKDW